ncbi:uncharacterized protein EV420DRAFT_1643376 [Desarmillaria tabescens]|uniref:Hydrophobin n=1 Tax=Armillaria tabescens TaxID=1929756 RepID=A0AA39N5D7_ARMTA|nr:uncharacterized protein EV420DRAFT_1643376 [Desarmillaria tabescens]KAK0458029.1 hypothetical protein EV420DRAFT_1643376 [Desarmillaria tabescens]
MTYSLKARLATLFVVLTLGTAQDATTRTGGLGVPCGDLASLPPCAVGLVCCFYEPLYGLIKGAGFVATMAILCED